MEMDHDGRPPFARQRMRVGPYPRAFNKENGSVGLVCNASANATQSRRSPIAIYLQPD
jgi:hypothetical protein